MVLVLIVSVALVAWALHLMQEAMNYKEFSLMLAGTLVASAAAALVVVYFLAGSYVGYMSHFDHHAHQNATPMLAVWDEDRGEWLLAEYPALEAAETVARSSLDDERSRKW
jgi:hypothetical protein